MISAILKDSELLSHQQYFALEKEQSQCFEYICGEVFAMAGGSEKHALISSNALVEFAL